MQLTQQFILSLQWLQIASVKLYCIAVKQMA